MRVALSLSNLYQAEISEVLANIRKLMLKNICRFTELYSPIFHCYCFRVLCKLFYL